MSFFSRSQLQANHTSLQAKYSDKKKTLTEVSRSPFPTVTSGPTLSPGRSDLSSVDEQWHGLCTIMKLPSPAVVLDSEDRACPVHTGILPAALLSLDHAEPRMIQTQFSLL